MKQSKKTSVSFEIRMEENGKVSVKFEKSDAISFDKAICLLKKAIEVYERQEWRLKPHNNCDYSEEEK